MKKIRKVLAVVLTLALMLSLFSDGISATLNEMLPNGETEMTVEGSIESSVGMGDEPYVAPPTPETVIFGAVNGGYMPEVTLGGISDKVVSGNTVTYTYNDTDFGPVNVTVKFSCSTNSHSLNAPVGSAGPIFDYCDKIDISFDFYKVPDGQLAKSQLSIPLTIPSEGNLFDLPNYYDNKDIRINDVVNGSIYVAGDYHYDPANGNLVLNFNSKFTSPDTKNRNFNVYVEVIPPEPGDDYQNDKEFKLHLWDQDYNFSYHDSEGTVNAQKSAEVFEFIPQKDGQPAKLIIKYTAKAVVSGRAQDLTIQDLITANESSAYKLIQDSINVVHDNNGHSNPEFTHDSIGNVNCFTMNFPGDYKNGDYVQVEYLVEYTGDQLDNWSKGENLDYNAYVNKLTAKGKKYALNEVIPDSNASSGLPYLANTGLYKSNTWTSKIVDGKAYYVATYTGSIDFSAFYNNLDAASKSEIDSLINSSDLPGAIEKLLEMYGRQPDIKDELYVGETRYADLSDKIKSNLTVNSPFDGKFNFSYTVDIEADKVTDGEIVKNKLTVGNSSTEDSGFNPNQKEEVTGSKRPTNGYNKESGEIRWHDEFSLPKVYDSNLQVTDSATIDVPASLKSMGEWKHLIDIDSIKIYASGTEIDKNTYGIVITPSSGLSDYFTVSFSDGALYSNLINSGNGQTVTSLSIEYNTKVTLNGEVYEFGEGEGLTAYNEFLNQKVEAKVEGETIPIEGSFKKEKLASDPEDDDYTFKWRISLTGNPFKWENGKLTLDENYTFRLTDIPHDMEVLDLAEDGHLKNLSFKRFDSLSEYGDWDIGFYMGLIDNKTINGDVTKSGQEIYDELRSGIVQRLCSMIKVTENGDGSVDLVYNPSDPALGSQVEEFNRWINFQPLIVNNEWNEKYDFGQKVLANAANYITITYKTKFAGIDASVKSEVDAFIKGDTIPLTNILRGTVNGSLPFESKPSVQINPKKFLVKSGFEYKDNIEKADQAYYTNLSYDYQRLDFFKGENFKKYVEAYYSSGDINKENNFLTNYLYVIDVNPDALKFGTQGYIEVQDIMGNGLTLAESSVRLVEVNGTPGAYTSGTAYKLYQQGSGFSLTKDNVPGEDNKNHSYTFRMKDGQHYLLVYWARVVYSVDSDGNFITSNDTDDYKNSVTVDGYGLIPVEGSTRFNGSHYVGVNGSSASKPNKTQFVFKFHKIGVEDVNVWTDLVGVEFTFTPYIWDGSVGNGELKLVTDYSACSVKSDEDGLGSVSLEKEYIYEVTENLETVPEGYEGFDKKVYVVFKETFDNLSKEAQKFLESGDLRIIESSIDEQKFFNTKTENKGSLKVTKIVEDPNGVGIPTDDEFTFTVSFNTSAEIPDPTYFGNETGKDITKLEDESNTGYKSFEFTLKNGESVLFTGIPVGTEYNVEETSKENYISTSSNASGTVTGTETPTVEVTYTNIYNVIAKDVPKLYKKLDGKPADKQFTFKVETDFDPADGAVYDGSGTVQNNKDGEISLGKITFYKAGDYKIIVSEVDGGDSNILYDTKTIVIKYSVTTDSDGKLAVSGPTYCDKDGNEVTGEYANTFNNFTGTSKELKVNKKLVPKTTDSAYLDKELTFTFKAEVDKDAADNKATDESIVNKTVSVTVPAGVITSTSLFEAAEEFKFSFSEEGNYSYKISENDDQSTNVDYDGKIHTVEFTVENVEGKLTVTTVKVDETFSGETLKFVNKYQPDQTSAPIEIKKEVTGGYKLKGEDFRFEIKALPEGSTSTHLPSQTTVSNDINGDVSFGNISYTKVGTYYYVIQEIVPDPEDRIPGMTYSNDKVYVTVTVSDTDGVLSASVAYSKTDPTVTPVQPSSMRKAAFTLMNNEGGNDDDKTIVNTYETYKADGKLSLKATKTLTGRDLKAGEFKFAVKEGNSVVAEATNDADGNIVFPDIAYTLDDVGEHTYTVYEVKGDLKGVTYSSTNYVITVTVADGGDGKLMVTSADMPDEMLFRNEYNAAGTATIEAAKTLTGKTLAANQFTFKAEELDSEGKVIKTFTGANDADGKISITIPYTQEDLGTHTYKVTEVNDKKPGYTYSENALTVTVTVSDNGDGTLKTEIEYAEGEKTFINTYKAEGEATIEAAKTLTGKTLAAGDFTFSAVEVDDNNKPIENAKTFTGVNDADGKISIEITYTQDDSEGAHRYLVSEVKDDKDGIVYSDLQFIATVNVTDNGDGTITASEPVYTKLDGTVITDMTDRTFGNTYNEATGSFSLAGFKRVEGDTYGKSADYQYNFTVTEDGKSETVTAKAGMVEFIKNRVYTEKDEGKHVIIISENDVPENRHITTDKAVYTVTVNVTPGEYHTMKVEIESIAKSGAEGNVNIEFTRDGTGNNYYTSEKLEFVNTYKVETVSVPFTATKTVSGRPAGKWYEGDKYSFTLKGLDGAKMPVGAEDGTATAENVAGTVAFGTVTYDESDIGKTYTYEVREVIDNKVEGVKYDGSVYTVEVTVTENADGTLKADTVYKKGEESASGILFANEYETEKTNAKFNLSVNKKLAGDPAPEETYVFTVDGTDYKASVKGEGSAEIISAEYDKAGTYVYNVRETKGSTVGMEYDGRYYQVTVTVTETTEPNGDITLKVEDVKIINRNADGSEIASVDKDNVTFTNTYRKPVKTPVSYSLKAEKSVEGNAPEDYSYSFEITKDGVSTLLENVKPGEFEFINETYDEAGEHTYTVREIPGGLPGMTYDGAEYTVKTTVTEHTDPATGDKSYTVEAVITKNGASASEVEFVNVYKVGGFSVEKEVSGTKGVTETERDWNFTVELDTALNGTYGDMTFTEGRSSFTLKSGEKLTAENIPVGVTYKVTETDADTDGYTTSVEGVTAAEVTEELKTVKFINHKDKDKVGLSVEKIVTGTAGETDRDFNFTVTLSDNTINGAYGEMTFVNGVARFTLRHGQKKAASGLPADIGYKVVETEANLDDYVTTFRNDEGQIPEGGTAAAVFVNSRDRKVGSLTVRKQVTGEGAEAGRRFTFSVVLSDVTVNGQYGDMYFNSGRAVFTLAHGQSATAMGLPVGISYNVIELDAGDYTSTALEASGVITENGFAETVYINNKDKIPEFGGLSVTKTVVGEGFDPDQEFTFTVTLDDGTINGTYGDISFSGGVATFKLKNGESAYADNLPAGTGYTVTEEDVEDYVQSSTGSSGTVEADRIANASFVNTYEAPATSGFGVSKTVTGTAAEPERVFTFLVTLSDSEINGVYGDMVFSGGTATLFLSNGQTAYADGLPIGTGYSVTEIDAEDYQVSSVGASGTVEEGVYAMAAFINHKDAPAPEVPLEEEGPGPYGDDMGAGQYGKDKRTGDDMGAGAFGDDMNPATGDYETENAANTTAMIAVLWALVFIFGAVVIRRKKD